MPQVRPMAEPARGSARAWVLLGAAALLAALCVWSWLAAQSAVAVNPVVEGAPATESVVFDPSMVTLFLLAASAAGVCAVLGVARLRRSAT